MDFPFQKADALTIYLHTYVSFKANLSPKTVKYKKKVLHVFLVYWFIIHALRMSSFHFFLIWSQKKKLDKHRVSDSLHSLTPLIQIWQKLNYYGPSLFYFMSDAFFPGLRKRRKPPDNGKENFLRDSAKLLRYIWVIFSTWIINGCQLNMSQWRVIILF